MRNQQLEGFKGRTSIFGFCLVFFTFCLLLFVLNGLRSLRCRPTLLLCSLSSQVLKILHKLKDLDITLDILAVSLLQIIS